MGNGLFQHAPQRRRDHPLQNATQANAQRALGSSTSSSMALRALASPIITCCWTEGSRPKFNELM